MIRNLKLYDNAVISNSVYKILGEKEILEKLKKEGLNCYIDIVPRKDLDVIGSTRIKEYKTNTIIIRLKGR